MSKGKSTSSSTNRLPRYMKAPLRVLCPARDLYMSSMTSCAGAIKMEGVGYHMGGYMMASVPRAASGFQLHVGVEKLPQGRPGDHSRSVRRCAAPIRRGAAAAAPRS